MNCLNIDIFRRQLEYKQIWAGGNVLAVNPRNTSRTCLCCGYTDKDNRPTQAKFECVVCGFAENADLVGAMNILAAGHAVLARGVTVQQDHTVKREPAEETAHAIA
jgi:putative transposase